MKPRVSQAEKKRGRGGGRGGTTVLEEKGDGRVSVRARLPVVTSRCTIKYKRPHSWYKVYGGGGRVCLILPSLQRCVTRQPLRRLGNMGVACRLAAECAGRGGLL